MPKQTTKKRALNLFSLLSKINNKETDLWDSLTEEQRKEFVPYLTMRWLCGTSSEQQVFLMNHVVNPLVFSLQRHPRLLFNLMCACTDGQRKKCNWTPTSKKSKTSPMAVDVIKKTYRYNTKKARDALLVLSNERILQLATDLGMQPQELKQLKTELQKR